MGVITITIARSKPDGRRTRDKQPSLATLYHDLYERLHEALEACLEDGTTHDDYDPAEHPHAPAGQSNGGQFVSKGGGGPVGEKPTSVKAKLTKAALHELLSTGHPFSKKELLDIMGPEHKEVTVNTWLSKFKSQKHAGEYGALDIKKLPNGSYQVVMPNGQPAPPAPAAAAPEPAPKVEPVKMEHNPEPHEPKVSVPFAPVSKEKANKSYEQTMDMATLDMAVAIDVGADPEQAVLAWKKKKQVAMAQWATNVHGNLHEPKIDGKLYEADKILAKAIKADTDEEAVTEAITKWKHNTLLEKQGKLNQSQEPAPKPDTKTLQSAVSHWLDAVKNEPAPTPKPYAHLVPKGFKHISGSDFTAGTKGFQAGIMKLKNELIAKGKGDAIANKKLVEQALQERLKDKKHYQAFNELYKKNKPSYSLEHKLVAQWAQSSGDHHSLSCALQQATQDAFALPESAITKQQLGPLTDKTDVALMKDAASDLGVTLQTSAEAQGFRKAMQEFVHAQYENTQDFFKAMGQDHIYLARGMKMTPPAEHFQGSKPENVTLQPASSFSASYQTASQFAGSSGTVFLCKVPVTQLLGSYLTGFGCTSEHEVVVLGHDTIKSFPVKKSNAGNLAQAVSAVKERLKQSKGA